MILIVSPCQKGKTGEIVRAAGLAQCVYRRIPYVFVKRSYSGGHDSIAQLRWHADSLNEEIDAILQAISPGLPIHRGNRFKVVIKTECDSATCDMQVVCKFSNPEGIISAKRELHAFYERHKSDKFIEAGGIFDEDDLNTQSAGRNWMVTEKELFHLNWETHGSLDLFVPAFSRRFRSRPPSVLSLCAKMDPCESLGSRSGRDRCHLRDVVTTSDTDNLPEGMVQLVNDMVEGSGKGTNHCGTRVGLIQNCKVRCLPSSCKTW